MLVSEQSAANSVLAWRHFMGTSARRDPPPVALQEISRLVAGQRLTNLGWALMTRLQSKEWNVAEVAKLISASVEDLAPMLVTQQAVVERSKSLCAALSGSSWETKLGGMRVRAVRAPKELTAAVAQRIADLHDGVVGMSYHEDGTGTVSASLAGREDVHVEGLASAYGGTGTGATGEFEFDESLLDRLARGELRSLDVHRERAIRLMGHCAGLAAGGTEADVLRQPGHVLSVQQSDWSRGRALARAPRLADLGLSSVS